jgi:hypothetical protein
MKKTLYYLAVAAGLYFIYKWLTQRKPAPGPTTSTTGTASNPWAFFPGFKTTPAQGNSNDLGGLITGAGNAIGGLLKGISSFFPQSAPATTTRTPSSADTTIYPTSNYEDRPYYENTDYEDYFYSYGDWELA